MIKRALQSLTLFLELTLLGALALVVVCGSLPSRPGLLIWMMGFLLAASLIAVCTMPQKCSSSVLLHVTLLSSSAIFTLPFIWLVTSSGKSPEELAATPGRWLPKLPPSVMRSPYVSRGNAAPPSPEQVNILWDMVAAQVSPDELQELDINQIVPAVTSRLSKAMAEAGLTLPLVQPNDRKLLNELIDQAWRESTRAVIIGQLKVIHADHRGTPLSAAAIQWQYQHAHPVPIADGSLIQYDFSRSTSWQARAEVIPSALPSDFVGFSIPLRQDGSWHGVTVEVICNGRATCTSDALYLGSASWVEWTFRLPGCKSQDQRRLGIWPLSPCALESNSSPSDRLEFIITVTRSSAVAATWAKLTASYRAAWYADSNWTQYMWTSLFLVGANVVGQLLGCSMAAYAFARLRWPGRDAIFLILLSTMMLPALITTIPSFLIFRWLGWYNTLLPLWLPSFCGSAFFIFMLRQFMKAIPRDLEEAALIDGCSWFGIYWRIVLPLLKPALAAIAIFTFLNVWNDFMGPLIFISDQRLYPLSLGLYDFASEYSGEWPILAAASTLVTLPVVLTFLIAQQYFIQNATFSGVKA